MTTTYEIIPYSPQYQPGVDALLDSIADEFEEMIYGPATKPMSELAQIPGRSYWVVPDGEKVIGTIGIAMIARNIAVLKGMMLHKDHRGSKSGLARHMLQMAEQAASEKGAVWMYLGTMIQFKAAQRFYEKQGYENIMEDMLPVDFPANPVDKVFYRKAL